MHVYDGFQSKLLPGKVHLVNLPSCVVCPNSLINFTGLPGKQAYCKHVSCLFTKLWYLVLPMFDKRLLCYTCKGNKKSMGELHQVNFTMKTIADIPVYVINKFKGKMV